MGISILFLLFSVPAEATQSFSVEAVLPENQVNKEVGYFHLCLAPSEQQTVEIKLYNDTSEEQTYRLAINPATTNRQGAIVYDRSDKASDNAIQAIAKPKQEQVTVAANSVGKAEVEIIMPSEAFPGIQLGGIWISEVSKQDEGEKGKVAIQNKVGYAIALLLVNSNEFPVYGESGLKLLEVKPESDLGRSYIEAAIQNPYPEIQQELTVEGKILLEGKVITEAKLENVKIAPNSVLPFQLELEQPLETGTYSFEAVVSSKEHQWDFQDTFEISKKVTNTMKENVIKRESKSSMNLRPIIIWVIFSLLFLGLVLVMKVKIKQRREDK
ncbi:hypothetical protein RV10_GL004487 [Enterococcus pallens]|nr:hypothetical protein RV10_GL004487 [Enterococcus pallens]